MRNFEQQQEPEGKKGHTCHCSIDFRGHSRAGSVPPFAGHFSLLSSGQQEVIHALDLCGLGWGAELLPQLVPGDSDVREAAQTKRERYHCNLRGSIAKREGFLLFGKDDGVAQLLLTCLVLVLLHLLHLCHHLPHRLLELLHCCTGVGPGV